MLARLTAAAVLAAAEPSHDRILQHILHGTLTRHICGRGEKCQIRLDPGKDIPAIAATRYTTGLAPRPRAIRPERNHMPRVRPDPTRPARARRVCGGERGGLRGDGPSGAAALPEAPSRPSSWARRDAAMAPAGQLARMRQLRLQRRDARMRASGSPPRRGTWSGANRSPSETRPCLGRARGPSTPRTVAR